MMTEKRTRKEALALFSGITAIVLAISTMALVTYWKVYPYDYIIVEGDAVMMGPSTVKPGEAVVWSREKRCVAGDIEVTSQIWAQRNTVVREVEIGYTERLIPDIRFMFSKTLCQSPSISEVIIPEYITPGEYILQIHNVYEPNPIRTVDVVTTSPPFTVVK
jgi:hypothetical protein